MGVINGRVVAGGGGGSNWGLMMGVGEDEGRFDSKVVGSAVTNSVNSVRLNGCLFQKKIKLYFKNSTICLRLRK